MISPGAWLTLKVCFEGGERRIKGSFGVGQGMAQVTVCNVGGTAKDVKSSNGKLTLSVVLRLG
jgi:hypothetical protein